MNTDAYQSARKYYWFTAVLVCLTVGYSIASYISTTVSKDVIKVIVATCKYENDLPCPPSFLDYIDKKDADILGAELAKRAHFTTQQDYPKIKITNYIDFNISTQNLLYYLKWLNLVTLYTLPECLKYYDDEPSKGCVGTGNDKVGIFIALFDPAEKLLTKVRIFYDATSTFLLPIFYSLLGASVYNLRNFAATESGPTSGGSRLRAGARMLLALTAGAIIGFFQQGKLFQAFQSETGELTQQATAFLVGYGVEILFSAFDGIVDLFKKLRPT